VRNSSTSFPQRGVVGTGGPGGTQIGDAFTDHALAIDVEVAQVGAPQASPRREIVEIDYQQRHLAVPGEDVVAVVEPHRRGNPSSVGFKRSRRAQERAQLLRRIGRRRHASVVSAE
jgi:hypothetical protein